MSHARSDLPNERGFVALARVLLEAALMGMGYCVAGWAGVGFVFWATLAFVAILFLCPTAFK